MLAMDGHSDKKKMRQNEYDTFLNLQEILQITKITEKMHGKLYLRRLMCPLQILFFHNFIIKKKGYENVNN